MGPANQPPGWARSARAVLATLAVVAGLFGVAEFAARARVGQRSPDADLRLPATALRSVRDAASLLVPDRHLLWRNRPGGNAGAATGPGSATTDARGFRRTTAPSAAGSDPFRILCVGDSVTFGLGVADGETWPSRLAALLAERHGDVAVDVVNAAVPGWSWLQGEAFLLREGYALQPGLVIAAHGAADQQAADRLTDAEALWLRAMAAGPAPSPLALVDLLAPPGASLPARPPTSPGCRLQEAAGASCRRVALGEIGAAVYRIADAARTVGAQLLVLGVAPEAGPAFEAARLAAVRAGVPAVDHVGELRDARVRADMKRCFERGLAMPRVPMVPFGRIGIPEPEGRGPRVRLRVVAPPSAVPLSVRGHGEDGEGLEIVQPMLDDGTGGDEKAGDGVFTAVVELPLQGTLLRYRYETGGQSEFAAAGIDTDDAWRVLRMNRDSDAPLDDLGSRDGMLDALLPDAKGQRRIAERAYEAVVATPAFRARAGMAEEHAPPDAAKPREGKTDTAGRDAAKEQR